MSVWNAYIAPALTENVSIAAYFFLVIRFLKSAKATELFQQLNDSYSPWQLATVVTFVLTTAFYWIYASLYFPVDLYHLLEPLKLQPKKHVDWNMHIRCIKGVLVNQFFVGIPQGALFYLVWDKIESWSGNTILTSSHNLPSTQTMALHFFVFAVVEEIGFYYSHRLAHHPNIYKAIHKKHHIFTSPIAAAAIFAHPIEHFVSNLAPVLSGPLVVSLFHFFYPAFPTVHLATVWAWMILAQFTTITTHSGYKIPGFPDSRKHDFHHEKFNVNFGVLGILDYLHGTDKLWLEKMSEKTN
jgi:sterol desaturase/sphingolipid hydroxylase (fatty acid hydroxylase superfamily)